MDKLVLNVQDIGNKEDFLRKLQHWLDMREVTANGSLRIDVDPETDEDKGTVQIINNAPVLPGREVKYGSNLVFWGGIETVKPWLEGGDGSDGNAVDRGVRSRRGDN